MTFLAPLWLAGLAALAVPIVLHLLGRGRAPRLPTGSVRLLREVAAIRARRVRPRDLPLLALRCLLLAALAVALAGPRRVLPPAEDRREWLLVDPAVVAELDDETAAEVAAAAGEGRARLLTTGLPVPGARGAARHAATANVPGGAWSLLREADLVAPAGAPLRVVTAGLQSELAGERPVLARPVRWQVVAAPGELVAAVEERAPAAAVAAILHDPARREDATLVTIALEVAAEAAGRPLRLHLGTIGEERIVELPEAADLLVWLSASAPGEGTAEARVVLSDGGGEEEACAGIVELPPRLAARPLATRRCAAPAEAGGEPLWRLANGRPLLTAEPAGDDRLHLRYGSRLHPAWGDLVLDEAFAVWLGELLALAAGDPPAAASAAGPAPPAALPPHRGGTHTPRPRSDERPEAALWALVGLLAVAERGVALRRAGGGV